jgi:hypothetical protein
MAILLKIIAKSRLKATALESNRESIEIITISKKKSLLKCKLSKPEEKIEFSSLMYEIKVLPLNYPGLFILNINTLKKFFFIK